MLWAFPWDGHTACNGESYWLRQPTEHSLHAALGNPTQLTHRLHYLRPIVYNCSISTGVESLLCARALASLDDRYRLIGLDISSCGVLFCEIQLVSACFNCKRAPTRCCLMATGPQTEPPTPPSPPSVRRVGGGFEYSHSARYPAALVNTATYETYKALPAVSTPLTVDDVLVVSLILRHAEATGLPNSSQPVSLSVVLRSYHAVLKALKLDAESDTHFYRIILKLSLDKGEADWWARLLREIVASARRSGLATKEQQALMDTLLHWRTVPVNMGKENATDWAACLLLNGAGSSPAGSKPGEAVPGSTARALFQEPLRPAQISHGATTTASTAEAPQLQPQFSSPSTGPMAQCSYRSVDLIAAPAAGPPVHVEAQRLEAAIEAWRGSSAAEADNLGEIRHDLAASRKQRLTAALEVWQGGSSELPPKRLGSQDGSTGALASKSADVPQELALAIPAPSPSAAVLRVELPSPCPEYIAAAPAAPVLCASVTSQVGAWGSPHQAPPAPQPSPTRGSGASSWSPLRTAPPQSSLDAQLRQKYPTINHQGPFWSDSVWTAPPGSNISPPASPSAAAPASAAPLQEATELASPALTSLKKARLERQLHLPSKEQARQTAPAYHKSSVLASQQISHETQAMPACHKSSVLASQQFTYETQVVGKHAGQSGVDLQESGGSKKQLLARVFALWRQDALNSQRKLRRQLSELERRTLSRALQGWRRLACRNMDLQQRMTHVLNLMLHKQLAKCFRTWENWAQKQKRARHCVTTIVHSRMAAAFKAWQERAEGRQRARTKAASCVLAMRHSKLKGAFSRWREHCEKRLATKDKMTRCLTMLRNHTLAKAFRAWMAHTKGKHKLRKLAQRAVATVLNLQKARAFHRWQDWAIRERTLYSKAQAVLQQVLHSQQAKAWRSWRVFVEQQQAKRSKLERACQRWTQGLLAATFLMWRGQATYLAARRDKMERCMRLFKQHCQAKAFRTWQGHTQAKRRQEELLRKAAATILNARAARALRHWREWTAEMRVLHAKAGKVVQLLLGRRQAQAWRTWRTFVEERHAKQGMLERCIQLFSRQTLAKAFRAWVSHTVLKRGQMELLRRAAATLLSARGALALRRWRERTADMRALHSKAERVVHLLSGRLQARAWRTWRTFIVDQHATQEKLQSCMFIFSRQAQAKAFRTWTANTVAAKAEREVLQHATASILKACAARALRQWRACTAERKILRGKADQVVQLLMHRQQGAAWRAWMAFVEEQRHEKKQLRQVLGFWTHRQAKAAFSCWREWQSRQAALRMAGNTVMRRWCQRSLAAAWAAWKQFQGEQVAKNELLRSCMMRLQQGILVRALQWWRQAAARASILSNVGQKCVWRLQQRLLLRAWNSWGEHVAERRWKHELGARSIAHLLNRTLAAAFQSWVHYSTTRAALWARREALLLQAQSTQLRRCFAAWVGVTADERKARRVIMRLRHGAAIRVLQHWRELTAARQQLRLRITSILQAAAARFRSLALSTAWAAWAAVVADGRSEAEKLQRAVTAWRSSRVRSAFSCWRLHYQEMTAEAAKLQHAVSLFVNSRLGRAWRAWVAFVDQRHLQQAALARTVTWWRLQLQAKAYREWIQWHATRRLQANKLVRTLHAWKHSSLLRCWAAWLAWVEERREAKARLARCIGHILSVRLGAALQAWKIFTSLQQDYKDRVTAAAYHWGNITLGRALRTWRANVILAAQLKNLLKRWQASKAYGAFQAWREWQINRVEQRNKLISVTTKLWNRLLLSSWNAWRVHACNKQFLRSTLQHAVQQWTCARLRAGLAAFMSHHERVVRATAAVARWRQAAMSKAFEAWRAGVAHQQGRVAKLTEAAKRWHAPLLADVFSAWREAVARHQALQERLQLALVRWRSAALARAWETWREQVWQRLALAKAVGFFRSGTLAKAFRTWACYSAYSHDTARVLAHALSRWSKKSQASCLAAWQAAAQRRVYSRKVITATLARMQNRLLAAAFGAWQSWISEHERQQEQLARACLHWNNAALAAAFSTWREGSEQQKLVREQLALALQRWKGSMLRAAFAGWQGKCRCRRDKRTKIQVAVQMWRLATLRAAMEGWKAHIAFRLKAKRVLLHCTHQASARAFLSWRSTAQSRHQLAAILEAALQKWQICTLRAAFAAWQEFHTEACATKDKLQAAVLMWSLAAQSSAFSAWRQCAEERRSNRYKMRCILSKITNNRLLAAFNTLRGNAGMQKRKRAALTHWTNLAIVRCWAAWRQYLARSQHHQQVMQVALGHWSHVTLVAAFCAWKEGAQEQAYRGQQLQRAVACFRAARLCSAWNAWRGFASEQAGLKARAAAVIHRMLQRQLLASWNSWRQYLVHRRKMHVANHHRETQLVRAGLAAFKRPLHQKAALELAVLRMLHRQLAGAWAAWIELVAQTRERHALAAEAGAKTISRLRHRTLWSAWGTWKTNIKLIQTMRCLLGRVQLRHVLAAFHSWRQWVQRVQQAKALLRKVLAKSVAFYFARWREASEVATEERLAATQLETAAQCGLTPSKRAIFAIQGRKDLSLMAGALAGWRRAVWERNQAHENLMLAYKHLYYALAWRCFAVLRAHAMQRHRLRFAVKFWGEAALRRAWQAWRHCASISMDLALKADRALAYWTGNTLKLVFLRWREFALQKMTKAAQTTEARQHYLTMLQRKGLLALADYWLWRQEKALKLYRAQGHMNGYKLLAALHAWRQLTARARTARAAVLLCHTQLGGSLLQRRFYAWHSIAARQAYLRRVLRHILFTKQSQAFAGWKETAAHRKRLRQLGSFAVQTYATRSAAQVFVAWRSTAHRSTHTRRALTIAAARLRNSLLLKAFSTWKAAAQLRMELKASLSALVHCWLQRRLYAAFGQWREASRNRADMRGRMQAVLLRMRHIRLAAAFAAWLSHHADCQHKQGLMRKAARFFTGSTVSRAFATWREAALAMRLQGRAVRHGNRVTLLKAFAFWQAVAHCNHQLNVKGIMIAKQWLNRHLATAFHGWVASVEHRVRLRCKAALVVTAMRSHLMRSAFNTWAAYAHYKGELAGKVRETLAIKLHGSMRSCFNNWREGAQAKLRKAEKLRCAIQRLQNLLLGKGFVAWRVWTARKRLAQRVGLAFQNRLLYQAWQTWVQTVEDTKLEGAALRHSQALLLRAFHKWQAYRVLVQTKREKTHKAAELCFGSIQLRVWRTWKAHVASRHTKAAATRLAKGHLVRRAWGGWQAVATQKARLRWCEAQLAHAVQQPILTRLLSKWQRTAKCCRFLRHYYLRRGLQGWSESVTYNLEKKRQLHGVMQLLLHGSVARCFVAWREGAQVMVLKREAFRRKQAGIKRGLEIGDAIIAQRRRVLAAAVLSSWRFKTKVGKEVQRRLAGYLRGSLQGAWGAWRRYHAHKVDRRQMAAMAQDFQRFWCLQRALTTWRGSVDDNAAELERKLQLATSFAFENTLGYAFLRWVHFVELHRRQRHKLAAVLEMLSSEKENVLVRRRWGAWQTVVSLKRQAAAQADVLAARQGAKLVQELFNVWWSYTRAMRADPDPDSPFLSPRLSHADSDLVWGVAEGLAALTRADSLDSSLLGGSQDSYGLGNCGLRPEVTRRAVSSIGSSQARVDRQESSHTLDARAAEGKSSMLGEELRHEREVPAGGLTLQARGSSGRVPWTLRRVGRRLFSKGE